MVCVLFIFSSGNSGAMAFPRDYGLTIRRASNSQRSGGWNSWPGWFTCLLFDSRWFSYVHCSLWSDEITSDAHHCTHIIITSCTCQGNWNFLVGTMFTLGILSWRIKYSKGTQLKTKSVKLIFLACKNVFAFLKIYI